MNDNARALQDALLANQVLENAILAKNAEIDRLKGRVMALDKEISALRRPLGDRYIPLMKYKDKP